MIIFEPLGLNNRGISIINRAGIYNRIKLFLRIKPGDIVILSGIRRRGWDGATSGRGGVAQRGLRLLHSLLFLFGGKRVIKMNANEILSIFLYFLKK